MIKVYSDNTEALILADPLYYDGTDYYEDGFSLKDHRDLARRLATIKGKAMVLHSENDQIHKLYTGLGFSFKTIRTKYASRKAISDEDGNRTSPIAPLYMYMNF
ncbi:hypothetical protein [Paenibacillus sp. NPDC055715]